MVSPTSRPDQAQPPTTNSPIKNPIRPPRKTPPPGAPAAPSRSDDAIPAQGGGASSGLRRK